jgi:hypothetical protein
VEFGRLFERGEKRPMKLTLGDAIFFALPQWVTNFLKRKPVCPSSLKCAFSRLPFLNFGENEGGRGGVEGRKRRRTF